MTGNTVIDACLRYGPRARPPPVELPDQFALATAHRAENVDDPVVLRELVDVFVHCPVPVVYPVHPRTHLHLENAGLVEVLESSGNVQLLPPVGYLEFLGLLLRCEFVLTDSGGVQEEATAPNVRKKAFVLRESTERPEAVLAGYVEVLGIAPPPWLRGSSTSSQSLGIPRPRARMATAPRANASRKSLSAARSGIPI